MAEVETGWLDAKERRVRRDHLRPLQNQVAGHPSSVLTSEDGSCIVKPSLPLEIEFYESTAPTHFPELVQAGLIPGYYGVQQHNVPPKEGKVKLEQAIKLENLTHGFVKPNVIDIKLGTQLYDPLDPNLTPDKQARMEKESARTTSGSDGLRLTGFTVYDAKTHSYVSTPKQYGKAIPASELVNGIRRFFPCSSEGAIVHSAHELTPTPPLGLPPKMLLAALDPILAKVREVQRLVDKYEWRIYGGSLLVVYEGSEEAESKCTVKLIDFAHARYLPGKGKDEGMLKGLESVLRLLEGRVSEVKLLM